MELYTRMQGSTKLSRLIFFFAVHCFWVVNLVQSLRFRAAITFFFGITAFFVPESKCHGWLVWGQITYVDRLTYFICPTCTGDNFVLPWTMYSLSLSLVSPLTYFLFWMNTHRSLAGWKWKQTIYAKKSDFSSEESNHDTWKERRALKRLSLHCARSKTTWDVNVASCDLLASIPHDPPSTSLQASSRFSSMNEWMNEWMNDSILIV